MIELNLLAIGAAAVAAFVVSSIWYSIFARNSEATTGANATRPETWKLLVELLRSLVVAVVLAGLVTELGIISWTGAALLGLALWIAFPVVLLTGSVIWEDVPPKLAATHAGDWLVKLVVVAVIVRI